VVASEVLGGATSETAVEPNLVVVDVHTGQYRSAGGAAKRLGDEGFGEGHAPRAEQGARLGHVGEVVVAHVVGEYEDEVGLGARLTSNRRGAAVRSPQCCSGRQGERRPYYRKQDNQTSHEDLTLPVRVPTRAQLL
jgi:hypothetical protein